MPSTFTLTPEQRAIFDRDGMLRVPGFIPSATLAPMVDALWDDMRRRFSLDRDKPETWKDARPAQFQRLVATGAFDAIGPYVSAVADTFVGAGEWTVPPHFGFPLVTFPTGHWDVPHNVWHFDIPPHGRDQWPAGLPEIRTFIILDKLESGGGGTCYIEGSHRVAMSRAEQSPDQLFRSADMKKLLQDEEPWFAALFDKKTPDRARRFMQEGGEARGIKVKVKELTGEPGDAFIMHPAMFHTIASNARQTPRLMLVQALSRPGAYMEPMA
jgi:ectoine hydroxylase-related dioxygenase (phytanoyl-CoA dioxygenase family)